MRHRCTTLALLMSWWSIIGCAQETPLVESEPTAEDLACEVADDCPATLCRKAACIEGWCASTPQAKVPCDDGNACTEVDICDAAGLCVGSVPKACPDNEENPCVSGVCDPSVGTCGFEVNPSASPSNDRCHSYQCVHGVLQIATDTIDCEAREIPAHGCVERYECDTHYVHPKDGSPCRPMNRPAMSACTDADGDHIVPGSTPATSFQPSECSFNVCYAAAPQGESDCVNTLDLPKGVAQDLREQGDLPIHACTFEDLPEANLASCNAIRCACAGGDCSSPENASCQVYPVKDAEEGCDTGNPCDISR
jgi:hypothetical protein